MSVEILCSFFFRLHGICSFQLTVIGKIIHEMYAFKNNIEVRKAMIHRIFAETIDRTVPVAIQVSYPIHRKRQCLPETEKQRHTG